jgi:hypothetical protein
VENAIEATHQFQAWLVANFEAYTTQATSELVFLNAYPPSDKEAVAHGMGLTGKSGSPVVDAQFSSFLSFD